MNEQIEASATRTPVNREQLPDSDLYLLVIENGSSRIFLLPSTGVILIGRNPEADLHINAPSLSRRHAKIMVADRQVRVGDLDSHNGTRVNGERIEGARTLARGDVISLGEVTLVLQCASSYPATPRSLLEFAPLRLRLEEEIERSISYERSLTLLGISFGQLEDRAAAIQVVTSHLHVTDVAGWDDHGHVLVLLPERASDAVAGMAKPLLSELSPLAPETKCGFATCPTDACDADTLLSAMHAALAAASPQGANTATQTTIHLGLNDRSIIIADPAMTRLYDLIRRLAASDLPVLICGETGVGKENAAFAVHYWSPRTSGPFVTLNCAAMQETLIESELFGHEKGAFTGAVSAKPGLLETAGGGTVFLDEVGELSLTAQARLLRALESKRITRVGEVHDRAIDIRVVAASNHALEEDVQVGRFRQDLFFRLSAAMVVLPPLRSRPREVPILARTFLAEARARAGQPSMAISHAAMLKLTSYAWPGNVRELKNVMEYVAATVPEEWLRPRDLPERIRAPRAGPAQSRAPGPDNHGPNAGKHRPLVEEMRELERRRILEALQEAGGVQTRAAELLGMPLRTLVLRLKQHGLRPSDQRSRE